jgi:hypothetical protein
MCGSPYVPDATARSSVNVGREVVGKAEGAGLAVGLLGPSVGHGETEGTAVDGEPSDGPSEGNIVRSVTSLGIFDANTGLGSID